MKQEDSNLRIGYHASHEQFKPSDLLKFVRLAEQAGFNASMSSDHFAPWSLDQGESGFAWSWLGAAMQATKLPFGIVNAPGQRYHPAIIAQAAATLAEMFPERFWVAMGSGQYINEQITGEHWPVKQDRNDRLKECVDIIRALWNGETVTHHGLVTVEQAKLYTRPKVAPMIIGAAITEKTAEWVGGWADGLITTSRPPKELKKMVEAFRKGGGEGKPMYLKVQLSYAQDEKEALEGAHDQWRSNIFPSAVLSDLRTAEQLEQTAKFVREEDLREHVRISSDPAQHLEWLQQDIDLGFSQLILHNVNMQQERFIEVFGEKVVPQLLR
ncbi:TIGR03885 family FMN-dependent LLM class oxidoreductase [Pontibacter sp. JH31]|uniref:TIGR03885 family FMN-dependent LLM class oxidoreductase n=1 Tax=Pontibacter aquaedesilientis TaxID=2766980 RepID=A0ABR7XG75_9BACT|nr:TIGR03885 family FMN-dependent LLM class oxidoreductase [Pontibacter aquaedesilientis]MBD1397304.1 TIGR03885 family FMN-dependent LLM class oxidoreductase [Pontibacter aquaedesilientis]